MASDLVQVTNLVRIQMQVLGFAVQCDSCKHLRANGARCAAYPGAEGIPPEIFIGEIDHTEPYPGDQGITYKAKD